MDSRQSERRLRRLVWGTLLAYAVVMLVGGVVILVNLIAGPAA